MRGVPDYLALRSGRLDLLLVPWYCLMLHDLVFCGIVPKFVETPLL